MSEFLLSVSLFSDIGSRQKAGVILGYTAYTPPFSFSQDSQSCSACWLVSESRHSVHLTHLAGCSGQEGKSLAVIGTSVLSLGVTREGSKVLGAPFASLSQNLAHWAIKGSPGRGTAGHGRPGCGDTRSEPVLTHWDRHKPQKARG